MTHINTAKLLELAQNGLNDADAARHLSSCQKCAKIFGIYRAANKAPDYATPEQVEYCRGLFRKSKFYYRCITDQAVLDAEIFKRTGFDMSTLTKEQAQRIIDRLDEAAKQQRTNIAGVPIE